MILTDDAHTQERQQQARKQETSALLDGSFDLLLIQRRGHTQEVILETRDMFALCPNLQVDDMPDFGELELQS